MSALDLREFALRDRERYMRDLQKLQHKQVRVKLTGVVIFKQENNNYLAGWEVKVPAVDKIRKVRHGGIIKQRYLFLNYSRGGLGYNNGTFEQKWGGKLVYLGRFSFIHTKIRTGGGYFMGKLKPKIQ